MHASTIQQTDNAGPAKPVKVFHGVSEARMEFSPGAAAEYAVAYAYCDEHHRLPELNSHRDNGNLPELYAKLPMQYGHRSVACGDWMAACLQ